VSKNLKIGIVGVGTIGTMHAEAFRALGLADVQAICDVDRRKLASKGDKFGVKQRFADYRDLLKTPVEAVCICVPNAAHKQVAIASLKAGKHVFLEKPMAINAAQARQIAQAAARCRRVIQIGMVNRQAAAAQLLRRLIEEGQLGDIYHMRATLIRHRGVPGLGGWFTTKAQSGGGPMIDLGVHWFDLCMWLSGNWKPTAVSAKTYSKFGCKMGDYKYVSMWAGPPDYRGVCDVEDYSTGFVRFGAKATMSFEIAWAANTRDDAFIEILGDKGGARIMHGKPLTVLTEHNGRLADITPQFDDRVNIFEEQARKFVAACRGKMPPAATARQGVVVMKLIDAIYASSRGNREVAIQA